MQSRLVKRDNLTLPSFEEKKDACEIIKYKNKKKLLLIRLFRHLQCTNIICISFLSKSHSAFNHVEFIVELYSRII